MSLIDFPAAVVYREIDQVKRTIHLIEEFKEPFISLFKFGN